MTDIMCNINATCPFKGGRFCKKEFLSITQAGQCSVWYDRAGNPRPAPYIQAEAPLKEKKTDSVEEQKSVEEVQESTPANRENQNNQQ